MTLIHASPLGTPTRGSHCLSSLVNTRVRSSCAASMSSPLLARADLFAAQIFSRRDDRLRSGRCAGIQRRGGTRGGDEQKRGSRGSQEYASSAMRVEWGEETGGSW